MQWIQLFPFSSIFFAALAELFTYCLLFCLFLYLNFFFYVALSELQLYLLLACFLFSLFFVLLWLHLSCASSYSHPLDLSVILAALIFCLLLFSSLRSFCYSGCTYLLLAPILIPQIFLLFWLHLSSAWSYSHPLDPSVALAALIFCFLLLSSLRSFCCSCCILSIFIVNVYIFSFLCFLLLGLQCVQLDLVLIAFILTAAQTALQLNLQLVLIFFPVFCNSGFTLSCFIFLFLFSSLSLYVLLCLHIIQVYLRLIIFSYLLLSIALAAIQHYLVLLSFLFPIFFMHRLQCVQHYLLPECFLFSLLFRIICFILLLWLHCVQHYLLLVCFLFSL